MSERNQVGPRQGSSPSLACGHHHGRVKRGQKVGATDTRSEALAVCMRNDCRFADRLMILFWDGTGLVMAYKRLEETTFAWPTIQNGVMTLNRAQFEALFDGLDWRKVRALEARRPAAAE